MTTVGADVRPEAPAQPLSNGLRLQVLARLAYGDGTTRAELARALGPIVAGAAGRLRLDSELAGSVREGLASEYRHRFKVTLKGHALIERELQIKAWPKTWELMRDRYLVAKALGLDGEAKSRINALSDADHLRAAILASAYGFRLKDASTPAKVCTQLAVVVLQRAFGNKIRSGLSSGAGFDAKSARTLAGQLLARPRPFQSDSALIAALAAPAAGAPKLDPGSLRLTLLRNMAQAPVAAEDKAGGASPVADIARRSAIAPVAEQPHRPQSGRPEAGRPEAGQPDLSSFAAAVQSAARVEAEGWPGNLKAMICRVWAVTVAKHPQWGLSEGDFKALLAEAHRAGLLVLATADLRDKSRLKELQDSAITYKNTVWHLIRVTEPIAAV